MSTPLPSRKRAADTPGWTARLFTSSKKPKTRPSSVETGMNPTESRMMPRTVLSPPSVATATTTTTLATTVPPTTTASTTMPNPSAKTATASAGSSWNGGSASAVPTINNGGTGTLLPAWKPLGGNGQFQFQIGSNNNNKTDFKRRKYRPPPWKPESDTLVMKNKRRLRGSNNNNDGPFDKGAMERLMQQNKKLLPKSTLQDDPQAFQRKVPVRRRLGTNQSGSRMPPPPPTQVSYSEQQQRVSFQEAQTPAGKSTSRLQRMQTPGVRQPTTSSSVTFDVSTPLPSANRMQQRQQTPGMGLAHSDSIAGSRTPGSSPGSSTMFSPRADQRPVLALDNLDGPYVLDGPEDSIRTLVAQATATLLPGEQFVNNEVMSRPKQPKFVRVSLKKDKKPQVVYTVDDDDDNDAMTARSTKRTKSEGGEKTTSSVAGWGAHMYPKPGEWNCGHCAGMNPQKAKSCLACEVAKPGAELDADNTDAIVATSASPAIGVAKATFSFGVTSGATPAGVSFGVPSATTPAVPAATSGTGFSFGAPAASASPPVSFGTTQATTPSSNLFDDAKDSFGAAPSTEPPPANKKATITTAPKTDAKAGGAKFNFGAALVGAAAPTKPYTFGVKTADDAAPTTKRISFGVMNDDEGSRQKKRRERDDDVPSFPVTTDVIATPGFDPAATALPMASPASATPAFVFGAKAPAATAPPTPAFAFGAASASNPFSASGTPAPASTPGVSFGAPAAALSFGTPAPTFGANPAAAAPQSFGATPAATAAPSFGATPAAPAAPQSFGATPAATTAPSFGATPAAPGAATLNFGGFGVGAPQAGTNSFGATPVFSGTSASTVGNFTGFGSGTPAPPAGGGFSGGAPAPPASGGFSGGAPAQPASGGFSGAPGGFAPPTNNFAAATTPNSNFAAAGGPNQFGGGMATPAAGGFSMGSSKAKTTGRRRIIKAKRPPGSANR